MLESLQPAGRGKAGLRRYSDQHRAIRIRAGSGAAAARAQIVINHLGRPPLPEQGWNPGHADCPRGRVPQHVDEAVDRARHHHALALVDGRRAPLSPRLLHPVEFLNRVMAASNWPVILLGASYAETWSWSYRPGPWNCPRISAKGGARRDCQAHLRAMSGDPAATQSIAGNTRAYWVPFARGSRGRWQVLLPPAVATAAR